MVWGFDIESRTGRRVPSLGGDGRVMFPLELHPILSLSPVVLSVM